MTSKKELERRVLSLEASLERKDLAYDSLRVHYDADTQRAIDSHSVLVGLLDDILVIEPQLKHLLTGGVWDIERVHRAAEHLRGEDALESVGYTSNCVEIDMSNVIPFPTDPDSTYRGAA